MSRGLNVFLIAYLHKFLVKHNKCGNLRTGKNNINNVFFNFRNMYTYVQMQICV